MTGLFVGLLATLPLAQGQHARDRDVWIPTKRPFDARTGRRDAVVAYPVPFGTTDQADTSAPIAHDGHLRVECLVTRGHALMVIVPERWPERLPEEIACTVAGLELRARVHAFPPRYARPEEIEIRPGIPAELRHHRATATRHEFRLPAGTTWAPGPGTLRLPRDGPWPGGQCGVLQTEGPSLLWVRVERTHGIVRNRTGTCEVRTLDGTPVSLPVATKNLGRHRPIRAP